MGAEESTALDRERMVTYQLEQRGIRDPQVLAAFRKVPRHEFVPRAYQTQAYEDGPLPIGRGQTISQPYIVALMTSLLKLRGDEVVLEIGTGSGYQAAILACLAKWVHTVERIPSLATRSASILARLEYQNVTVHCADGGLGWLEAAPYPAILVTAAAAYPPPPLLDQLAEGGRLVIPVGPRMGQVLQVWKRTAGKLDYDDVVPVSFVPLRGQHGWDMNSWLGDEGEDEIL